MNKLFQAKTTSFDDYLEEIEDDHKNEGFMVAYRLTGLAKVDGICEFLETLAENGAKFLVFAHHKSVIDSIEAFLKKKKIGNIKIDGSVPLEKRY